MAAAVNCLVMEPMAKTASVRIATPDSTSAFPYGCRKRVSFPFTTATTAPTVWSRARFAEAIESNVPAVGVRGCAASGDAAATTARSAAARKRLAIRFGMRGVVLMGRAATTWRNVSDMVGCLRADEVCAALDPIGSSARRARAGGDL
jgi:hypothetical protein